MSAGKNPYQRGDSFSSLHPSESGSREAWTNKVSTNLPGMVGDDSDDEDKAPLNTKAQQIELCEKFLQNPYNLTDEQKESVFSYAESNGCVQLNNGRKELDKEALEKFIQERVRTYKENNGPCSRFGRCAIL